MTTNNQCNHAEAIAREMHMYYAAQAHNESNTPIPHWADLTENEQQGWIAVANTALPIIGKHALEDVRAYLGLKASGASTWWKKVLLGLAYAAVGALGFSLFQGCGHSVDVTPKKTVVCKDGSLPGAGAGAYLLFPGPAGNGRSARRSIPEKVKP